MKVSRKKDFRMKDYSLITVRWRLEEKDWAKPNNLFENNDRKKTSETDLIVDFRTLPRLSRVIRKIEWKISKFYCWRWKIKNLVGRDSFIKPTPLKSGNDDVLLFLEPVPPLSLTSQANFVSNGLSISFVYCEAIWFA